MMEKTWRWFGRKDKITLDMLRQIGVEGIVTALHDVPNGEIWTLEKILDLKQYIESFGLRWSVVESLPVCESIKYGGPDRDELIEKYGVIPAGEKPKNTNWFKGVIKLLRNIISVLN